MTLREWVETQDTRNTVELLRRLHAHGPQVGTTDPQIVDVYSAWEKQRIQTAKTVFQEAGLTRQEVAEADATSIAQKISAWINGKAAAARPIATIQASAFFGLLFERLAERDLDTDEDAQRDIGSRPIYGPSVAEQNGWENVTGNEIEAAIREGA